MYTRRSVSPDLGMQCLPMSTLKRLIWHGKGEFTRIINIPVPQNQSFPTIAAHQVTEGWGTFVTQYHCLVFNEIGRRLSEPRPVIVFPLAHL